MSTSLSGNETNVKFASVNASTVGDNTLVAAVPNKRIRVIGYTIVLAGTAPTAQWKSGAATSLSGAMNPTSGTVLATNGCDQVLQTAAGDALVLALGGTTPTARGHLAYVEIF